MRRIPSAVDHLLHVFRVADGVDLELCGGLVQLLDVGVGEMDVGGLGVLGGTLGLARAGDRAGVGPCADDPGERDPSVAAAVPVGDRDLRSFNTLDDVVASGRRSWRLRDEAKNFQGIIRGELGAAEWCGRRCDAKEMPTD